MRYCFGRGHRYRVKYAPEMPQEVSVAFINRSLLFSRSHPEEHFEQVPVGCSGEKVPHTVGVAAK